MLGVNPYDEAHTRVKPCPLKVYACMYPATIHPKLMLRSSCKEIVSFNRSAGVTTTVFFVLMLTFYYKLYYYITTTKGVEKPSVSIRVGA